MEWLRWASRTPGVMQAMMRRGAALILCLGVWSAAIFLVYDSADRLMGGGREGREMLTGVLTFPFSILVLVGALAMSVRLVRRWPIMQEELSLGEPEGEDNPPHSGSGGPE